ncbi:MAG: tRNA (adenosine(37)-N6)-threonylcarbamoyltransferase complex dimerization subunit type 1 TsaB [Coriobacteriia bacterium]|nr:tRNA (adenosine(37)-N6)-threonylcarbamoyltransferase complex dimerization subunit type 1 TsaB [Coriobacteriia bacterium]
MRYVLAFDTATEHVAIGLAALEAPDRMPRMMAEKDFAAPRAALGALLPAVRDVVREAGIPAGRIAIVAVGRGPGSFTGVRIGVASAKGLAHGLGAPLVGLGTLDAVAWRFSAHEGLLAVVGDAMRGEVYPALFRCSGGRCTRLEEDCVEKPVVTAERWARTVTEPVLLAGNGLTKYQGILAGALGARATIADESLWTPSGASLIAAAWTEAGPGSLHSVAGLDPVSAFEEAHPAILLPVYTRLSDAEEAEQQRGAVSIPPSGVSGPGAGGVS